MQGIPYILASCLPLLPGGYCRAVGQVECWSIVKVVVWLSAAGPLAAAAAVEALAVVFGLVVDWVAP